MLDAAAAFAAVRAGARFLVSPLVSEDVLRAGHRYGAGQDVASPRPCAELRIAGLP